MFLHTFYLTQQGCIEDLKKVSPLIKKKVTHSGGGGGGGASPYGNYNKIEC